MAIKFTESCRAGGKWAYKRVSLKKLPMFLLLSDLSELVTKDRDNVSKILINKAWYLSWTTSLRALGLEGVEMKIFERVKE